MGMVGAFIPVYPLPERPYRHPIYDRLWWTAQDLGYRSFCILPPTGEVFLDVSSPWT